ncbi:MAG: 30S ribosomal protein S8 [Armatimonadetes bacterium]|nr:MAG: 30S ribosomal protein S8 [Armatimonadota bacterium]
MDKVGDLLIRIKNGYMASKKEVVAPYSKLSLAICELLKKEGFIAGYTMEKRQIVIALKYDNRQSAMTDVKRVSKPGRRVYKGKKGLPRVYEGFGIAIVSTPKGIMTDKQARKEGVGGEIMAHIW